MSSDSDRCVIIGAGPAGLTAAWELAKGGRRAVVLEADDIVGGIARTSAYKGYRFDIGGHRFFTKVGMVQDLWEEMLGSELLERGRLSRIYYRSRFFDYPLKPVNALLGLGPWESLRIGLSYLKARLFPTKDERTFEQWVANRFGWRLYEIFFKSYTEKVWGIPCSQIGAEWAAQRIKNLDLLQAVKNALLGGRAKAGGNVITTLIDRFHYPRFGPGMMWERFHERLVAAGGDVRLRTPVTRLVHDGRRVTAVEGHGPDGAAVRLEASHVISSMPIRELVRALHPPPPVEVVRAGEQLRYRDFLTVVLIIDEPDLFPDNWIYIHSPDVRLGRIQNFKNWSPGMVPDPSKTALGLEYFVQEGDDLWTMADADLVALGRVECARLGLVRAEAVVDGCVVRMPKAYPVYDGEYRAALDTIRAWLASLGNLQLVGRNGQHRYNNQDHSMVTAIYAAQNIAGAQHDIWDVNVEAEYHEEVRDRAVPAPLSREDEFAREVRAAFARYDPVALGVAVGTILGVGLFLATALLLLRGGDPLGPNLALLGQYIVGFEVTWGGAVLGMVEAGLGGFVFGWLLARTINAAVGWHEAVYIRNVEMSRILEP